MDAKISAGIPFGGQLRLGHDLTTFSTDATTNQ